MKARQGGGAVKTYIGKREGVAEKPIFAYQGGRGGRKTGKSCLHSLWMVPYMITIQSQGIEVGRFPIYEAKC